MRQRAQDGAQKRSLVSRTGVLKLAGVVCATGVAVAFVAPAAANAATTSTPISTATAASLSSDLGNFPDLAGIAGTQNAIATNSDGSAKVSSNTVPTSPLSLLGNSVPLNVPAIDLTQLNSALSSLNVATVKLGALAQYAEADGNGSSEAFSGTVSDAQSLLGIDPSSLQSYSLPNGQQSTEVDLGNDQVGIDLVVGAVAASAKQSVSSTGALSVQRDYSVSNLTVKVSGSLLSGVLAPVGTLVNTLNTTLNLGLENPIGSDGSIVLPLNDLLAADNGDVALNQVAPNTNILNYVVPAIVNLLNDDLSALTEQSALNPLTATLGATLSSLLSGLSGSLASAGLGDAIGGLAGVYLNVQGEGKNYGQPGQYTESAIKVKVAAPQGDNQSTIIDLATAAVGKNHPQVLAGTVKANTTLPRVGTQVTASPSGWAPSSLSYSYQWFASGKSIAGATASHFTPTASQYGKSLQVQVTAKSSNASAHKTVTVGKVAAGTITSATPTISGTVKVGAKLTATANASKWSPSGLAFTYQWYAAGKAISGATSSTYKVANAYAGKTLTVKVTAKKTGYSAATATSAATKAVAK